MKIFIIYLIIFKLIILSGMKGENGCNTVVLFNRANLLHLCSSKPHPESPQRLEALIAAVEALHKLHKNKEKQFHIKEIMMDEGEISVQETEKIIIQLQGEGYWQFVKEMWHEGIKKAEMYINIDTYFMKDTYTAAIEAARTTIIAAKSISQKGQLNAFVMVRPPGHHSGMKSQPHGFSFFNNVALAANYLLKSQKAKRVAIVDWDVHHGEGTQKLFYNRHDVMFISLHRFDNGKFFPHVQQSSSKSIGSGDGAGFNVNICWNLEQKPKGSTYSRQESCGNEQYYYAFNKIVIPVLKEYDPDFVLVSCGFDSACGDPIGGLYLDQVGYSNMLLQIMQLGKNVLLVLEGGYNVGVLDWAGQTIVKTLTRTIQPNVLQKIEKLKVSQPNKIGINGVQQTLSQISKFWSTV